MKRPVMLVGSITCICAYLISFGCGGGGGGAAPSKSAINAKTRLVQATRLSRAVMAVTGLGRTITRSVTPPRQSSFSMNGRIAAIFSAAAGAQSRPLRATAPPTPALDPGTGLYYTTMVNSDGSGQQLLFVDSALTQPAGSFIWTKPKWATSQPGTYPAVITVTYNITAGSYAGVSGTMQVTIKDANFKAGLIELALTDSLHESASATLALSAEGISGEDKMQFGGGDSCNVTDSTNAQGDLVEALVFPDGASGDITTTPDGDSSQTYTNPDSTTASPDLSGSVQPDGTDTIDSGSGDTTVVNVDPGDDSGDSSGDVSGDSSGDSSPARSRKPASNSSSGGVHTTPTRPAASVRTIQ